MKTLELLAPAKNLECGIAAVDCGADAVYIGASRFGARVAAGNSVEDIEQLCLYAHQYGAKVFVTINTIIYDDELEDVRRLLVRLAEIEVDAILVQDMAILKMVEEGVWDGFERTPALHASTQTDNRDKEKVAWLGSVGFSRAVLARETSLEEMREIHVACPNIELEGFVHGALCVSYSGACYASQYCFKRSANRGECAQFCRMKFDLIDGEGKEIEHQRYLLSLKDMCQIDNLEKMADAGIVSFKIEGRLKDVSYVRNVVAAYSRKLDELCQKRPDDYCRASLGSVDYAFEPNLKKTFNRGFTTYFLDGRRVDIFSPDTPKAIGECVGKVKEIRGRSFNVAGTAAFANGDGLCFMNSRKELEGFRVNRVEGNRLFPLTMPPELKPGTLLYRNSDVAFEKELSRVGTKRTVPISMMFFKTDEGFGLKVDGRGLRTSIAEVAFEHQKAQKPQRENIIKQLSKLGDTIYRPLSIVVEKECEELFVPSSILAELRRMAIAQVAIVERAEKTLAIGKGIVGRTEKNVANKMAEEFYKERGFAGVDKAYEVCPDEMKQPLMQCKHCIRYSFGQCKKKVERQKSWKEPLTLRLSDGRCFELKFDCADCQMKVYEM